MQNVPIAAESNVDRVSSSVGVSRGSPAEGELTRGTSGFSVTLGESLNALGIDPPCQDPADEGRSVFSDQRQGTQLTDGGTIGRKSRVSCAVCVTRMSICGAAASHAASMCCSFGNGISRYWLPKGMRPFSQRGRPLFWPHPGQRAALLSVCAS